MLRQRVLTAIVLLLVLAGVLGSGSLLAFYLTLAIFFGAACWESLRLFEIPWALPLAVANVLGSWLGTRMALRHGSGFVRHVFLVVVGALILKTGYDGFLR